MPELPEVEITRLGLLPVLPGRLVTRIGWSGKRLRTPIPRKLLAKHILKARFATVARRAKYLLFRMEGGACMIVHLGMTGKLSLVNRNEPTAVHDHLRFLLDNVTELRFNDARRFGSITVWPPAEAEPLEKAFTAQTGIEPLGKKFTAVRLSELARSKKQPVKHFLMDARVVAGIGNIYANEILFAAAVHPLTPVNHITSVQWALIARATRRILKEAIQAGGSTISDFLGTSGNPGYFQVRFNVYQRRDEQCKRCSAVICKTVTAGRATYFCPACQQLPEERIL